MFYEIAKPISRFVLSWYYRSIAISGLENIPTEGPVILAANHPTAFIEPCILASFQGRSLWFIARGSLFRSKLLSILLNSLHILPIFRTRDGGYSDIKQNFNTLDRCTNALKSGKAIMILAEGLCIHEKRLRPIQKGTARIALTALKACPELQDIPVIPIGVNFATADKMRGEVSIKCGPAIRTSDFLDAYNDNNNQGLVALTKALKDAIAPLVVQLPSLADDGVGEMLLEIVRNESKSSLTYGFSKYCKVLDRQLAAVKVLKNIDLADVLNYGNRLRYRQLDDTVVSGSWLDYAKMNIFDWLKCILACLLLFWYLPLLFVAELIAVTRTRKIEFYASTRFAILTIGLLFYPLLWCVGGHLFLIAYTVLALVAAKWSWRQLENAKRWYKMDMMRRQVATEIVLLQNLRKKIVQQLPF